MKYELLYSANLSMNKVADGRHTKAELIYACSKMCRVIAICMYNIIVTDSEKRDH